MRVSDNKSVWSLVNRIFRIRKSVFENYDGVWRNLAAASAAKQTLTRNDRSGMPQLECRAGLKEWYLVTKRVLVEFLKFFQWNKQRATVYFSNIPPDYCSSIHPSKSGWHLPFCSASHRYHFQFADIICFADTTVHFILITLNPKKYKENNSTTNNNKSSWIKDNNCSFFYYLIDAVNKES